MRRILGIAIAFATLFSFSFPAFALTLCPNDPNANNFSKLCAEGSLDVNLIIKSAIQILLIAAVIVALVFLIWGGIKWITSGGDKTKVESARGTVIGAIIGLIIAFAAFFVLNIVASLFGLGNILELSLPSFVQEASVPPPVDKVM